jgi:predicted TIM-barrel fold metal-dependent hydrolase
MTFPIIDAHHHIWRQADLPWLTGPMQPRIFGPYESLRRDYPIAEFLDDLAGSGVERSVYVQANWPKQRFEDEVAWVQSVADETGWPHAIVGYVDLMAEDAPGQLQRLAKYPLLRGVRMQLHWHENEQFRFALRPDLMNDSLFRRNLARLADHGFCFELQVFAPQMRDAADLAGRYPKIAFVLQHAGMPQDLSDAGKHAWRESLALLAAQRNVYCKLSGFGTFIHRSDPAHIAWAVRESLALFGSERCLFGSNFPIEKLWTDYRSLIQAHRDAMASFSAAQQRDVFWNAAAAIYRIEDRPSRR